MVMDDWKPEDLAALTLFQVPGVGQRITAELLTRFGSYGEILQQREPQLRHTQGVGPEISNRIVWYAREFNAASHLKDCEAQGISVVRIGTDAYPVRLGEIEGGPHFLYQRGAWSISDELAIAIVGSRQASSYGMRQATRFAQSLAQCGYTVVSGLARGIDRAAHLGALRAGGRTVAVLGSGFSKIYPPEHHDLAEQVIKQGVLLTELAPDKPPRSGTFPRRNRIISGLSLAILVVEASLRSGALITARHAIEQNREVMAIPGSIEGPRSQGCHRLIRDGAKLVENVDDVLEELGPLASPVQRDGQQVIRHAAELGLSELEQRVIGLIQPDGSTIDELVQESGLPVHQILATLSVLESRRLIQRPTPNRVRHIASTMLR